MAVAGSLIQHRDPVYPELAKREHLVGVVVLDAVIGKDGRVHELRLVSSPSPILTEAAKAAISQWIYTPYRVDGIPEEVETTISTNFTFGAQ